MKQDNIKEELLDYKLKSGLLEKRDCTPEENQQYNNILANNGTIPENICAYVYDNSEAPLEFFELIDTDLTQEEKKTFIALKQLNYLKTIKNCLLYFTISSIVATLVVLFTYLYFMNS